MKPTSIHSISLSLLASLLLAGCGLAETGAAASGGAAASAETAKQLEEQEAKIRKQIDDAQKVSADQRAAAEADAE